MKFSGMNLTEILPLTFSLTANLNIHFVVVKSKSRTVKYSCMIYVLLKESKMLHQDTLHKHRNFIIGVNSPMHQSTFDDRVVTFIVNRCQHVYLSYTAKNKQPVQG